MRGRLALAFVIVLGLAGASPAGAEVRLDVSYQTYKVRGQTLQEVWRDIGRRGPRHRETGLYAQALAEISYGWTIDYNSRPGRCSVRSAAVDLRIKITLPEWAQESRAHPKLQATWRRYAAKVRGHEHTHRDIALKAAASLDRAVRTAEARSDCAVLQREIADRAGKILADVKRKQARFDRTDRPIRLIEGRLPAAVRPTS